MRRRARRSKLYHYDSKWEKSLAEGLLKDLHYHPCKLHYTKPATDHTYEPDWSLTTDNKVIYIEAKGRFMDRQEYTKYLHVRECLKKNEELVFLFMKPNTPMPGARKRKDGTIRTHAEWAESEDFRWYDETSILTLIGGIK